MGSKYMKQYKATVHMWEFSKGTEFMLAQLQGTSSGLRMRSRTIAAKPLSRCFILVPSSRMPPCTAATIAPE